ncbi:MAG TPA: methyltransferase domain-containing protein [Thermoanaerobaculia bacterium]|nr:methyltransferase domain-containing protein [Thermoanaerobaculia bacterium]
MKREFVESMRCPFCRNRLGLTVGEEDAREVREGRLDCSCGRSFPVHKGIPDFIDPTDETLAREVAGWIQLAGNLDEGLVPVMTALPQYPHPPWPHVAPDFFQIFEHLSFAGQNVVDIGAGRTWSSRFLKKLGLAKEVVAVDVLTTRFLGLETADIFFEADGMQFERVRGDIHRLPLHDNWADAVFSCAAIHHSGDLDSLFAEVFRVLGPGGAFVFISEPVKMESIPGNRPNNIETELGINEHFYSYREYKEALERAGFVFHRMVPRSLGYRMLYADPELVHDAPGPIQRFSMTPRGRKGLDLLLRNRFAGPWLYRKWSLPLSGIAQKPRPA